MYLDDNADYKTVWQLAHDWIGVNRNETNPVTISPKLRDKLIWLVIAIRNRKITARTRKGVIFEDNSIITVIDDFSHFIKS